MQNNNNLSLRIRHMIPTTIIIQLHFKNAATTTQPCNNNYSTNATYYACGTNRATTPFTNALIRLDRLQPPSLKKQQSYSSLR